MNSIRLRAGRCLHACVGLLLAAALCTPAFAETQPARTLKLAPVQTAPGVQVPADYLEALQKQLAEELEKTKAFTTVQQESPATADSKTSSEPVAESKPSLEQAASQESASSDRNHLRLALTITNFKAGSRTVRMLSSWGRAMGAGETRMVAHVQLTDLSSNQVLLERDVTATIRGMKPVKQTGGMILDFYVNSKKVTEQEAIDVSKEVKKAVDAAPATSGKAS